MRWCFLPFDETEPPQKSTRNRRRRHPGSDSNTMWFNAVTVRLPARTSASN